MAENAAACDSEVTGLPIACNTFDVRFGHNYNFNVVSFDLAHVDVRDILGALLWRVGRQFFTLNPLGIAGYGLLYDPLNSLSSPFLLALPLGLVKTEVADGIRADWTLGPLQATVAIFRDAILMPPTGVTSGLGSGPAIDHRIVHVSSDKLLANLTFAAAYYRAWQDPNVIGVNISGGSGWEGSVSGTLTRGLSLYFNYAAWQSIPIPANAPSEGRAGRPE